jgi:hypothetical protein
MRGWVMKKLYLLFICLSIVLVSACSNERHVNGRSLKGAFRSVKVMKEYLPKDQKLEFQVAFWTLRNAISDKEEFLDAVDGKTASEIIAAGKEKFTELRASGFDEYEQYRDWEDMIEKDKQVRAQQDLGIEQKNQKRQRDRTNNDILYDLH